MKTKRFVMAFSLVLLVACVTAPPATPLEWTAIDVATEASAVQSVSLALTSAGAPRIAYVTADGYARYAYCESGCADPAHWSLVTLAAASSVSGGEVSLALGPDDKPRVLIPTTSNPAEFMYMYCTGDCSVISGWTAPVSVACPGYSYVGQRGLALDIHGNPRTSCSSYEDLGDYYLLYLASCNEECGNVAHWRFDIAASFHGYPEMLVPVAVSVNNVSRTVDQPRLSYFAGDPRCCRHLGYAHCEDDCGNESSWDHLPVSPRWGGPVPRENMKLTVSGVPRFVTSGWDGELEYIACTDASCAVTTSVVFENKLPGPLALTKTDAPRLLVDDQQGHIQYGACDTGCEDQANWHFEETVIDPGSITAASMALDASDLPTVAYSNGNTLRYAYGLKPSGWGTASVAGLQSGGSKDLLNCFLALIGPLAMVLVWRTWKGEK